MSGGVIAGLIRSYADALRVLDGVSWEAGWGRAGLVASAASCSENQGLQRNRACSATCPWIQVVEC